MAGVAGRSGRPKGVAETKPRAPRRQVKRPPNSVSSVIKATTTKQLPLDVMLKRMMELWKDGEATEENKEKACAWAKECAPYLHPRLSSVEAKIKHEDLRQVDDAVLIAELSMLQQQYPELTPGEVATLASSPAEPRH